MKILITGGAGFIASHVTDAYVDAGHDVVIIDNLSTGSIKNLNPKARFYEVDICDAAAVAEVFAQEKPEIVNHHAAQISVTDSERDPEKNERVNHQGTINMLKQPGVKRFIFASTGGAMFSNDGPFPATEEVSARPISQYGMSKLAAEKEVKEYAVRGGFPFVILRYSNVFGPRQNAHGESGVMAIFSDLASRNKVPTIFRREASRDYVYVGDVARANLLALDKGDGEIIHVSTNREITNQQVYEAIAAEFGWQQQPVYKEARPGELFRSVLSNEKAKKVLGWTPKVSINDGLRAIHHYFSHNII